MRRLLITLFLIALFLEISGLLFSGSVDQPNAAMRALLESPSHQLQNPKQNGYFLLLGFAASAAVDPVQTGLSLWLESDLDPAQRHFAYGKAERRDLRIPQPVLDALLERGGSLSPQRMREDAALLRRRVPHAAMLAGRYERWLTMPFEDRGYGHIGTPRFAELFAAHRLYVGDGFARSVRQGLRRIERDLTAWRRVLAEAKTLPMKVMAAAVVNEDAELLAALLSRRGTGRVEVIRAGLLGQPLTPEERSLEWPIRHEFVVGMSRPEQTVPAVPREESREAAVHAAWLEATAGLPGDALGMVQRPLLSSVLGFHFANQRTLNLYAKYYTAVIEAAAAGPGPLPTLSSVARASSRTLTDALLSPVPEEPGWELFTSKMQETDARLRLAGLQAAVRRHGSWEDVPGRVALAGTSYYDPFTGLPMIWNAEYERLYSVGSDGLDDGGDSTFDIVVTLPRDRHRGS